MSRSNSTEKEPQLEEDDFEGQDLDRIDISSFSRPVSKRSIQCGNIGYLNITLQGSIEKHQCVILTVHDLGCDETMYDEFVNYPSMMQIRDRALWIHVQMPGQGRDAADLPSSFTFPSMDQIAESLIYIVDELRISEAVCFGEGAGANILARFAIHHPDRVLGMCLLHCTGNTAGIVEAMRDKIINWKLANVGMNPTAESYLILHRFGNMNKCTDNDQIKQAIEQYQNVLRTSANAKNLKCFVESYLKRSCINDKVNKVDCPVLLVAGHKSVFHESTQLLHQSLMKKVTDKGRVEFISVDHVANIIEEAPEKLAESFQYFLQGLGVVSAVPMHHVSRMGKKMRSMSMEEYDRPKFSSGRSMSGAGIKQVEQ